jgi:hypothetical protein
MWSASARQAARRGFRGLGLAAVVTGSYWVEPASGFAQEPGAASDLPIELHGFVSQGFIKSTQNEYLAKSKKSGSFEFSEVGFNFTKVLAPFLRAGLQLFAHDLGPIGNYSPQLDWFYLDYRFWDWLGARVGRTKMPFGLYNELNDVDVGRVPILLPQSIYPIDHREFLFAQTGGELYGDVPLGPVGTLEYRAYGGTLFADPPASPAPGVTVSNVDVPYAVGGRLLWSTPIDGLRIGPSAQALRFDGDYTFSPELLAALQALAIVPSDVVNPLVTKFRVKRWVASIEFAAHDLELSAEYSRLIGEFDSRAPRLLPPHTVNERYYAMASYRVSSWFTPGVYYSVLYPNIHDKKGRDAYQHDLAMTVRYDLNAHWLLKLEGHLLCGTAALDNRSLNGGAEPAQLAPYWGLFLLKTTAYF